MTTYPPEFIRAIPKTDLHLHLDGSLRLGTLIELARSRKVELPSYSEAGLRETVFKQRYADLVEYLQGFAYTCAVLQDAEALERVSYELAQDSFADGLRYIEVRYAPQLHVHDDFSVADVLRSVTRGLSRARDEINRGEAIRSGQQPRFEFGIIACAMRMFTGGYSDYFRRFTDVHSYTPTDDIYALASLELARAVIALRDREGLPIVAFDLAGAEAGYPAGDHVAAYSYVHKHFMNKTVHAGEAYGPESIFQAITELHADRIGHGCHLFSADLIQSKQIPDRDKYVASLAQFIAERRITLEVCLTSNSQTIPEFADIRRHPFGKMLEANLSVTLCTDNTLVSNTSVCNEIAVATRHFEIPPRQLKSLIIYGFKRSFFPGTYQQKRAYVRQVIDFYEAIARRHRIDV